MLLNYQPHTTILMQSNVHKTVESMTQALGPVFQQVQDWETIRLATVMVMARVIQATPYKGKELEIFDATTNDLLHALEQMLQLEEQAVNARAAERDRVRATVEKGIDGFGALTVVNGSEPGPALVGEPTVVETEATSQIDDRLPEDEDFPDSFEAPKAEDA